MTDEVTPAQIGEKRWRFIEEAKLALLERITELAPEMTVADAVAAYKVLTDLGLADEMAGKAAG